MSQKSVEIILGKLLTDEDFRRRFLRPEGVAGSGVDCAAAAALGLDLTAIEQSALSNLPRADLAQIAAGLDPRLLRSCCTATGEAGGDQSVTNREPHR